MNIDQRDRLGRTDLHGVQVKADNVQSTVLVDVVQLVEDPKSPEMVRLDRTFTKRLQVLDACTSLSREARQAIRPYVIEVRFIGGDDWEGQIPRVGRRLLLGLVNGERVDQIVEATPKAVEGVPHKDAEAYRRGRGPLADYEVLGGFG